MAIDQTGISAVPGKPVVLVILDGVGVNPSNLHNGVAQANTPNLDHYFSRFRHTTLNSSGQSVGLPDGQMGNSEVGHLTLGCGSVIRQDMVKISDAIASGWISGGWPGGQQGRADRIAAG